MFIRAFATQLLALSDYPDLDPSKGFERRLPLVKYIERIEKYGIHESQKESFRSVCLISLIYLEKIVEIARHPLLTKELYESFGIAFAVASKVYLDVWYKNCVYCKVAGISLEYLNKSESRLLKILGWSALIPVDFLEQRTVEWNRSVADSCRVELPEKAPLQEFQMIDQYDGTGRSHFQGHLDFIRPLRIDPEFQIIDRYDGTGHSHFQSAPDFIRPLRIDPKRQIINRYNGMGPYPFQSSPKKRESIIL